MASYQNYQQVIDALKAEYVNARNLKKTANTKKRATRAGASAKTRKDTERGSLESKLTTVKSSILSNLATVFNNIDSVEYSGLKNGLTNLKGKLAFIDSEIDRLTVAAEFIGGTASATELQTINSLKGTLTTAIYESESVIGEIYTNADYTAIKDAFLPNQFNNDQESVRTFYTAYESKYDNLYSATKADFSTFITSLIDAHQVSNAKRNDLVQQSKSLFTKKSELADLLDSQAPESQIASKEAAIDTNKAQMLAGAAELKVIEAEINYALSSLKMEKLKRMSGDLYELGNKLQNYRSANLGFLVNDSYDTGLFVSHKSIDFYQAFFDGLDQTVSQNLSEWGNPVGEFKYAFNKGRRAKEDFRNFSKGQFESGEITYTLSSPNRIMNIGNEQDQGNGNKIFSGISGFKNNASDQAKEFYVTYFYQLHRNTREYIDAKVFFNSNLQRVSSLFNNFNQVLFEDHMNLANAVRIAKRDEITFSYHHNRNAEGRHTGTDEQTQLLQNLKTTKAILAGDLEYYEGAQQAHNHKLNLHLNLFPDFYPQFDSLTSAKISASASYDSAYFHWNNVLIAQATIAYDNLQILYTPVSEALGSEFNDAYSSYISALNSKKDATAIYSSATLERDQAYAFLQTTLTGTAQIYIAAKDDYDAKAADAAIKDLSDTSAKDNFNAAEANLLRADWQSTAGFPDFQSALSNWYAADANAVSYKKDTVDPAYLALQAATAALDSHLSDSFGEELTIAKQGFDLKAVIDAKEQVDIDYDSVKNVLIPSNSVEISDLESQMTWVVSNPIEKRDAMIIDLDKRKKVESFNRIKSLITAHSVYIPTINSWCQGYAQGARERISQGFDGLLLDVKNFLETLDTTNLYANKTMSERNFSFEAQRAAYFISFIQPTLRNDWSLGEEIGNASQNYGNTFERIKTDGGISGLMQTISNKFHQSLRVDSGTNFADRIISEVVSGNPIVN